MFKLLRRRQERAHDRVQKVVTAIMRLMILFGIGWSFTAGDWEGFGIAWVALALSFIPDLLRSKAKLRLPIEFELTIAIFVFASVFLGSVGDAYETFWWWDALLHTASGVILGFGGFLIMYVLYFQGRLKASPLIVAFFTVCTGLALGAVWEIFEYVMDQNFGTNMQKNGLQDTMWDLIVDFGGAVGVAWAGYGKFDSTPHDSVVTRVAHRFVEVNPRLKRWWQR